MFNLLPAQCQRNPHRPGSKPTFSWKSHRRTTQLPISAGSGLSNPSSHRPAGHTSDDLKRNLWEKSPDLWCSELQSVGDEANHNWRKFKYLGINQRSQTSHLRVRNLLMVGHIYWYHKPHELVLCQDLRKLDSSKSTGGNLFFYDLNGPVVTCFQDTRFWPY